MRVDLDGVRLVTDPLLRPWTGPLRHVGEPVAAGVAEVDVALITHLHRDHCDLPSLSRLPANVQLVGPLGSGPLLEQVATGRVTELGAGDRARFGAIEVTATPALHTASRRGGTGWVRPVGYQVRGTRTVYVAGDTDLFPGMVQLAGADLALLPVGGWGPVLGPGHLDALGAAQALRLLQPRAAMPVHWGTLRVPVLWRLRRATYLHPGTDFRACARRLAPRVRILLPAVGEPVDVGPPA